MRLDPEAAPAGAASVPIQRRAWTDVAWRLESPMANGGPGEQAQNCQEPVARAHRVLVAEDIGIYT